MMLKKLLAGLLSFIVIIGGIYVAAAILIDAEDYYPQAEKYLKENYNIAVDFEGEGHLSWLDLSPSLFIETVHYGQPERANAHNVNISFNVLQQIKSWGNGDQSFYADVAADRIGLDDLSFSDVELSVAVGEIIKTTEEFSAGFYEGTLTGTFSGNADNLDFKGQLQGVPIQQFVSSFDFDINATADLSGRPGDAFVESLKGEVILRSEGGTLTGNNISRWAGDVLLNLLPGERSDTDLKCIAAPFKLENGVARTDSIVIDTGIAVIVGKGQVDLDTETLNFEFTPKPKDPSLVNLSTPITVTGPVSNPNVSVSEMGVLKKLGGLVASAVNPAAFVLSFSSLGPAPEDKDCFQTAETTLKGDK